MGSRAYGGVGVARLEDDAITDRALLMASSIHSGLPTDRMAMRASLWQAQVWTGSGQGRDWSKKNRPHFEPVASPAKSHG